MSWLVLAIIAAFLLAPVLIELRRRRMGAKVRRNAPGQLVELSQGQTHFRWRGPARGPVAVCIHGLSTPSFVWNQVADGLETMGYRVLTYDLYGRGYSDRVRGTQTRKFHLRQLFDLLESQGVKDEITMLGYSMGGSIAACFAAEEGHRLQRLVLIAPAGLVRIPDHPVLAALRPVPVIGDFVGRIIDPWLLRKSIIDGETDEKLARRMIAETHTRGFNDAVLESRRGILSLDLTETHREIGKTVLPVLGIWGEGDQVIPLAGLGRLAEVNRSARQDVIKNAGHGLLYTHPREVLEAIRMFVRET